jgi:integrase
VCFTIPRATYKAGRRDLAPAALVFATGTGGKRNASNVRNRLLAPAVERANELLAAEGSEPLPDGLTPHSLRRTAASIFVALGWDLARVMAALGHASPQMSLGIYARSMDWGEGERDRLRALVNGETLSPTIDLKSPGAAATARGG